MQIEKHCKNVTIVVLRDYCYVNIFVVHHRDISALLYAHPLNLQCTLAHADM